MSVIRLFELMIERSRVPATSWIGNLLQAGVVLVGVFMLMPGISRAMSVDSLAAGKALVMEKSRGNCLACHMVADGEMPGNIGPPLIGMKARFPDAEILRRQIWDATERNPDSRMPPFGRNGILDNQEIDLIVEYLNTL